MGSGCSSLLDTKRESDSEYDEEDEEDDVEATPTSVVTNATAGSPAGAVAPSTKGAASQQQLTQQRGISNVNANNNSATPLQKEDPTRQHSTKDPNNPLLPPISGNTNTAQQQTHITSNKQSPHEAPPHHTAAERSSSREEFEAPLESHTSQRLDHGASAVSGGVAAPPQAAAGQLPAISSPSTAVAEPPPIPVQKFTGAPPQQSPTTAGAKQLINDDFATQLPRRLQNKAIRSVTLATSSQYVPQPLIIQPAVLFGALGDMRGERVQHPTQTFDLRHMAAASRVILSYRLEHLLTQFIETSRSKDDQPKASSIGFGSKMKEAVYSMMASGPYLIEQSGKTHKAQTNKAVLQRVGMYASTMWMPSTLRKGNRKKQRSQFAYHRELLSILAFGTDSAAFFVAHMLPDVLINLQAFETNVRIATTAAVRTTLHKLYDIIVGREEKLQEQTQFDGSYHHYHDTVANLRAPKVDISIVYVRDDALYATTTIGAAEGQLFFLADTKNSQVVSMESDSHVDSEHSQDDKSISSAASFMSSSSMSANGGKRKDVKRRYDMPATTTFYCQLTDFDVPKSPTHMTAASQESSSANASGTAPPRMATFSRQASTSSIGGAVLESKPKFAIALATEAFWSTLSKKEVWELLYILTELEYEAATHRSVEKTPMDIVRMIDGSLAESTQQRLVKFYKERAEAHYCELPAMCEAGMALVLSEVAEAKAMLENADNAAKMAVTVITLR